MAKEEPHGLNAFQGGADSDFVDTGVKPVTEREWLECADPLPMLEFLRGKTTRRQIGLWVVGCYRALLPAGSPGFGKVMDMVERYAEGEVGEAELEAMHATHHASILMIRHPNDPVYFASGQVYALGGNLNGLPAALLRNVVGPSPFRRTLVDPAWLARNDATVGRMAGAIYAERCFGDLPILADALEDAGCYDEDILNHLRGPGPHVRGSWALDLILGKE